MKIKRILKLVILSVIIFLNFKNVYAAVLSEPQDTTETYEKWSELSDQEKQNYIQPPLFSRNINKKTINNKKNSKLKNSIIPSSYKLNENQEDKIELRVRDQQSVPDCWAYSTTNLIATNMQKKKLLNYFPLFSTRHMNYATSLTFSDGINKNGYNREVADGGNCYLGLNYCTSGKGPVLENEMPFVNNTELISIFAIANKKVEYEIDQYTEMPSIYKKIVNGKIVYYNGYDDESELYEEYSQELVDDARKELKQQIMNYGAVSSMTYVKGYKYFNNSSATAASYYCYEDILANHAITIVGWDDNYSADNFNSAHKPEHDGAYIVLNSHGTYNYDQGYMYVSYDDFLIEQVIYSVMSTSKKNYDRLYQHDELGCVIYVTDSDSPDALYMANVFTRTKNNTKKEYLSKVSIDVPTTVNVDLYANILDDNCSELQYLQSCGTLQPGYHTINLNTPIQIKGDNFVVAAKYSSQDNFVALPMELNFIANGKGTNMWDTATGEKGQSFFSSDSTNWYDLNDTYKESNFCIKAFTIEEDIINVTGIELNKTNLTMNVGDKEQLIATVKPDNADNKNVIWESSNTNIAKVDENGLVTALKDGTVTITVRSQDKNFVAECAVTIIQNQNKKANVLYTTHVQYLDWQHYVKNGESAGTTGRSLRLEAIKIKLDSDYSGGIKYSTHIQNIGWQSYVENNQLSGTTGRSLRLEAIKIKLTGDIANYYDIYYRVHVENLGWLDWAKNGEKAGTAGYSYRLEAIQVQLIKKSNSAPCKTAVSFKDKSDVLYSTHVQDVGWQDYVSNGILAGTTGRSLRLEGIKVKLNSSYTGNIEYSTHIQYLGWQSFVSNNKLSGTTGRSLRLEAIKIKLTGEIAEHYDVYYRVHIQDFGWLDWAKNGEASGSEGYSYRLEGIEIRLVEKGGKAPGSVKKCFVKK